MHSIYAACYNGAMDLVRSYMGPGKYAVDTPRSTHRDLSTPLMWASAGGHVIVAKYLIELGANVEASANGVTSLTIAASRGKF